MQSCHVFCSVQIYGSSQGRAVRLRQWTYGKLRIESSPTGPMLPRNTEGVTNSNDGRVYPDNQLFLAGGEDDKMYPVIAVDTLH